MLGSGTRRKGLGIRPTWPPMVLCKLFGGDFCELKFNTQPPDDSNTEDIKRHKRANVPPVSTETTRVNIYLHMISCVSNTRHISGFLS